MMFVPKPKNEFREFMNLYYESCRERIPQIEAIAAKWEFEDLIPGLSDYDARFLYADSMGVDDWCAASDAIGYVHLDICSKYPRWARMLEHLPGINLTWEEFTDDGLYYPEYHQWTVYGCERPSRLKDAQAYLQNHVWDERDEYFFLKRFLVYYGRYDREIDRAVNLGGFENKYPLHSRYMHYFCPAVQAAVCIGLKRVVRGKLESIREAKELFGDLAILDELLDVVDRHYEVPELYVEPRLGKLEEQLFDALKSIARRLAESITIVERAAEKSPEQWRSDLAGYRAEPWLKVFDSAKWARQMKGRLFFYANAPSHFDSEWVIEIELNRINRMFLVVPYSTFWELRTGEPDVDVLRIIEKLRGDVLSDEQADSTIEYNRLTSMKWQPDCYREAARKIVDVYEDFYRGLYGVTEAMKRHGDAKQ